MSVLAKDFRMERIKVGGAGSANVDKPPVTIITTVDASSSTVPALDVPSSWVLATAEEITEAQLALYGPGEIRKMFGLISAAIPKKTDGLDKKIGDDGWITYSFPQFGVPIYVFPDQTFLAVWMTNDFRASIFKMMGFNPANPPSLYIGKIKGYFLPFSTIGHQKSIGVWNCPNDPVNCCGWGTGMVSGSFQMSYQVTYANYNPMFGIY